MPSTFPYVVDGAEMAVLEVVDNDLDVLRASLAAAGIASGRPVLVVVGGAAGMDDVDLRRLRPTFAAIVDLLEELGGCAVDGGTDAGVMRLLGEARRRAGAGFPLVGVAARGTVVVGDRPHVAGAADLAPGHSHLVLVPGDDWGDECPWLADVAGAAAGTPVVGATGTTGGAPSVTLLVNGGDIAYEDAEHSHRHRREVIALEGSGRTADELTAALSGDPAADPRARALVADGPVSSVPLHRPEELVTMLRDRLWPAP